jgi:ribonuclease P protein component
MASGHAWQRRPGAGCWQRGGQRVGNVYPPESAISTGSQPAALISVGGGLVTLKARADFLRVAAARRQAVAPGFVLQAARQPGGADRSPTIRVGFTASRKVGNAVTRNRAKRRLRHAAAEILSRDGRPGTDYVLIARGTTVDRSYGALVVDLKGALRRIDTGRGTKRADPAEEG